MKTSDCQVLDQSVNHAWKKLKREMKRKPGWRTNGGFMNDVLSSWNDMKKQGNPYENIENLEFPSKSILSCIV